MKAPWNERLWQFGPGDEARLSQMADYPREWA